ncbi:hypothetical protein C1X61_08300 [Pseudomonas sp. FW215-T2]|nr:hypothetical protein C1X61_08300 [Pseudomonas sp. FW215-T2]PNA13246.1 hypothetical protein C1X62_10650 [Pseudomonas sp. FW215-R3]PNB37994.1 hypothetical protein C1X63_09915 [Pseudomonas sp. FW305-131]
MAHYPVIGCACHCAMHPPLVGASLLAMVVNDNAGSLTPCATLGFFASRLAPTFVRPRVVRRSWRGSNCGLCRRSILAPFCL